MAKSKSSYGKKLDRLKKKKKSFSVKDTPKGKVIKTKGKNGKTIWFTHDSTTGELQRRECAIIADRLHSKMLLIDSHMKWVKDYTGQAQVITFKDEYPKRVVIKLWHDLKYNVAIIPGIGIKIELFNCTIIIYQTFGKHVMKKDINRSNLLRELGKSSIKTTFARSAKK